MEAEPPGADNTGGRSEGKVTTVQAPAKPAKRRVDHLRVMLALVVCVLAVSCGERTAPPAPDPARMLTWLERHATGSDLARGER